MSARLKLRVEPVPMISPAPLRIVTFIPRPKSENPPSPLHDVQPPERLVEVRVKVPVTVSVLVPPHAGKNEKVKSAMTVSENAFIRQ